MSLGTLSFAMLSDLGRVRRHNEDACAASLEHGIFTVCDGVGGAASGEIASRTAADAFLSGMISAKDLGVSPGLSLRGAIEEANRIVYLQAQQVPAQRGMATTLVALVFESGTGLTSEEDASAGTIWLANVGDSRCYRLRNGHLEQLTRDHSVVEEQVRAGELTRAQADVSPIRNVITRAIGCDLAVEPDLDSLPAHHGDLYLLCSDGLIRDLSDAVIAELLHSEPISNDADSALAATCERLVQAANERGGGDNITCLLVHVA